MWLNDDNNRLSIWIGFSQSVNTFICLTLRNNSVFVNLIGLKTAEDMAFDLIRVTLSATQWSLPLLCRPFLSSVVSRNRPEVWSALPKAENCSKRHSFCDINGLIWLSVCCRQMSAKHVVVSESMIQLLSILQSMFTSVYCVHWRLHWRPHCMALLALIEGRLDFHSLLVTCDQLLSRTQIPLTIRSLHWFEVLSLSCIEFT